MIDDHTITQLKQCNPDALRQMMDVYGDDIVRFAFLLVRDQHLAEDIGQEVFLRAYQKIHQFKGSGSIKGWLIQITLNKAREKLRSSYFKRFIPKIFTENEIIERHNDPVERSENNQLLEIIHRLPHKYREVILLYYYEDLTTREISSLLQEKEGTVKSKLSRARSMLKKLLESEGWNDAAFQHTKASAE